MNHENNKTFKYLLAACLLYAGGIALESYYESQRYTLTLHIKGMGKMVKIDCFTLKESIEKQITFEDHALVNIQTNEQMGLISKWFKCRHF